MYLATIYYANIYATVCAAISCKCHRPIIHNLLIFRNKGAFHQFKTISLVYRGSHVRQNIAKVMNIS